MDDGRTVLGKIAHEPAVIDDLISQTRDVVERPVNLLRAPRPTTFLGRKMQEPVPNEDEAN